MSIVEGVVVVDFNSILQIGRYRLSSSDLQLRRSLHGALWSKARARRFTTKAC